MSIRNLEKGIKAVAEFANLMWLSIGELNDAKTNAKNSLIAMINELYDMIGAVQGSGVTEEWVKARIKESEDKIIGGASSGYDTLGEIETDITVSANFEQEITAILYNGAQEVPGNQI